MIYFENFALPYIHLTKSVLKKKEEKNMWFKFVFIQKKKLNKKLVTVTLQQLHIPA